MYFRRSSLARVFPAARLRPGFRRWGGSLLFSVLAGLLSGCDPGDREATVTGRRDLVLWDRSFPNNLKDQAPEEWRRVPWTQMRYYNYRFGESEEGDGASGAVGPSGASA